MHRIESMAFGETNGAEQGISDVVCIKGKDFKQTKL